MGHASVLIVTFLNKWQLSEEKPFSPPRKEVKQLWTVMVLMRGSFYARWRFQCIGCYSILPRGVCCNYLFYFSQAPRRSSWRIPMTSEAKKYEWAGITKFFFKSRLISLRILSPISRRLQRKMGNFPIFIYMTVNYFSCNRLPLNPSHRTTSSHFYFHRE